jgi:nucleoside-triphosphatase
MMNIVITGNPRCGKTTLCEKVIERLEKKGIRCGGVICPEIRMEGKRIGTNAVDVTTGEDRIMAMSRDKAEFEGVDIGGYRLSIEGIEFGKNAIERSTGCDLIVIDEIGALELTNNGLMEMAEKALDSEDNTLTIVRSKLKKTFLDRFGDREFIVFDVNEDNRDRLPEEISRRIENGC